MQQCCQKDVASDEQFYDISSGKLYNIMGNVYIDGGYHYKRINTLFWKEAF